MVTFTKNQVKRGLASLHTHRKNIVKNHISRSEVNYLSDVIVNPTLTEGVFYVELPNYDSITNVSIFNVSGKIVNQRQIHQKRFNTFDISGNSDGIYIVKITDNINVVTKKIIKI